MGLSINSNVSALGIQRQTRQTNSALLTGSERLATGLRINRAADDAAGLGISERLRGQIRQLNAEIANLQAGVQVTQTAEGGLAAQGDAVNRLRELAVQASNGTLTDDQRAALDQEAQQLLEQIDDTAAQTNYNGTALLDGSTGAVDLGTEGGAQVELTESTAASLGLGGLDLSTQAGAQAAIEAADTALEEISANRASLGAQQNQFESAIQVRETEAVNTAESESRIRDLDYARQVLQQTQNQILLQGGLAALGQSTLQGETAARLLGG